jgi:thymidylate synthase (FAD)
MPPRIFLVSEPSFDLSAMTEFLRENQTSWKRTPGTSAAEQIVEAAGRICYMSFGDKQSPRSTGEYISRLIDQGHESVLEHVNWSFIISGVSRAFTHQLVRHRVGFSFSQLSQQYHEETKAEFIEPQVDLPPEARVAWDHAMATAKKAYAEILESLRAVEARMQSGETCLKEVRRAIRSTARSVLPNATQTKICVTANARALRHFFTVRGALVGDLEMRQVCAGLLKIVKAKALSLFFDFEIETLPDGTSIVIHKISTTEPAPVTVGDRQD